MLISTTSRPVVDLRRPLEAAGCQGLYLVVINTPSATPPFRHMNVRGWDRIVGAGRPETPGPGAARTDHVLSDLGSQYGAYEYCTSVGFAA